MKREVRQLSRRLQGRDAPEEWRPWRETVPGIQVRDRVDGTGCEIAYTDTPEGRAELDKAVAHFAGMRIEEVRAEFPSVFDASLGLDTFRRLALLLGNGHVLVDDAADVAAVERVLGPLRGRLGLPLDDFLERHPDKVVEDGRGQRTLILRGIPWASRTN